MGRSAGTVQDMAAPGLAPTVPLGITANGAPLAGYRRWLGGLAARPDDARRHRACRRPCAA
jgi:hypothetical protein